MSMVKVIRYMRTLQAAVSEFPNNSELLRKTSCGGICGLVQQLRESERIRLEKTDPTPWRDNIKPGISTGRPGSTRRIEDLARFYSGVDLDDDNDIDVESAFNVGETEYPIGTARISEQRYSVAYGERNESED